MTHYLPAELIFDNVLNFELLMKTYTLHEKEIENNKVKISHGIAVETKANEALA